jgi:hypothetical protein
MRVPIGHNETKQFVFPDPTPMSFVAPRAGLKTCLRFSLVGPTTGTDVAVLKTYYTG